MQKAIQTLDYFPSISQLEDIARDLGIVHQSGWKYTQVADCLACGGCGWHWVRRIDGGEAPVACDSCAAGKNMQKGPKGTITHTMRECVGVTYLAPGIKIILANNSCIR